MRIDVHNHLLPEFYVEAAGAQAIGGQGSSGRVPAWDRARLLHTMQSAGITKTITSFTAPGVSTVVAKQRALIARRCNEYAAGLRFDHPGQFGMFATLPLPDIDASLNEIAYAFDVLQCEGVCLLSNYEGSYLGEPKFEPLYAELQRRAAVIFVHPTSPMEQVRIGFSMSSLEFPFDTTRTAASLMVRGILKRFPSIRFILSHAGGALPYLVERLDLLSRNNLQLREYAPDGFTAECARFYVDTALSTGPATFAALRKVVPLHQILFGTDFPFGPPGQAEIAVAGLSELGLSSAELAAIEWANAKSLFRDFADPAAARHEK